MLRLSYLSPRYGEQTVGFTKDVIRFGRARDCEVCLEDCDDPKVAPHHGELVLGKGGWELVQREGVHGTWVDGKRVRRCPIRGGERINLGSENGPELRVSELLEAPGLEALLDQPTEPNFLPENVKLPALPKSKASPGPTFQPPPGPSSSGVKSAASPGHARSTSAASKKSANRAEKPGPPVAEPAVIDLARTTSMGPRRTSTLGAHPSAHNAAGVAAQPEILLNSEPVRVSPIMSTTELSHTARKSQEPVVRGPDGEAVPEHTFATRVAMGAAKSLLATLKLIHAPSAEVEEWLARAQRDIAKARKGSHGLSSGDTMVIMARALIGLREHSEGTTRKWRRYLVAVVVGSVLLLGGAGTVIYFQHQRINRMVNEKMAIDAEIQRVYATMGVEQDEQKLSELDDRLQTLMKQAATKLEQVEKAAPKKAVALEKPADPLDVEIKAILKSFNAETYAIPPVFRIELQRQINDLLANKGVPASLARKNQYWPTIQKALVKRQLPVELGYIAYTESHFDPTVVNAKSKATGMWQLMDETARKCGITVNAHRDDRTDPARSSSAAACYLSKLLVEFGEESFMLVLASYNRGENGVRNALHRVANEPGGFRKRDFWHLYRLKLLPDETRDYVPKVIAAAIVLGNPEKYGLQAREPSR